MKNTVVVGAQWGDEGKAKITDLLAEKADMIIRYQGGCNAGHTVVYKGETYKYWNKWAPADRGTKTTYNATGDGSGNWQ